MSSVGKDVGITIIHNCLYRMKSWKYDFISFSSTEKGGEVAGLPGDWKGLLNRESSPTTSEPGAWGCFFFPLEQLGGAHHPRVNFSLLFPGWAKR